MKTLKKKKATNKSEYERLIKKMKAAVSRAFMPPPAISSLDFVERFRILRSAESATQGLYSSAPTPFVREWHAALDAPQTSQVTIIAPAQTGKTTFLQNVLMSQIVLKPQPMLFLFPTLEMAKIFSRGRLRAVLNNKIMKGKVSKKNHATVNMNQISFHGGSLILCGSNNVAALSSHPIATLFADEIDRLNPDSTEGQPLELAKARTRAFFSRKILLTSTPTTEKGSQIYREYSQGSQERYGYICPHCHVWTEPSFERLAEYKWDAAAQEIEDAELYMGCSNCGGLISEGNFRALLMSGGFSWKAAAPEIKEHRSFWLNGFVSPFVPWAEIIKKYEQSKGDPTKEKVFRNTVLAELHNGLEIDTEKRSDLLDSREFFGAGVDMPPDVTHLVAGVDTQDRYLRFVVFGYGKKSGLVCVESGRIDGVPSDASTFAAFRAFCGRKWRRAGDDFLMPLDAVFVDSQGHYSGTWYQYAYDLRRAVKPKIMILKGAADENAPAVKMPPTKVQVDARHNRKADLYLVGVSALKTRLYQYIDEGLIRFSAGGTAGLDQEFFDELLSEVPTYSNGRLRWTKIHRRNEALDCSVYCLAAFEFLKIHPAAHRAKAQPPPSEKPKVENNNPPSEKPKPIKRRPNNNGGDYGWGWF